MTVAEILSRVAETNTRHTVVTGGEPMLFKETVALCEGLRGLGQHITIETAGTVFQELPCDLMSISPKLANSTPHHDKDWGPRHEALRWQPEVIRQLMESSDYQLKFVVAHPTDLDEIHSCVKALNADAAKVLLMPEGRDNDTLAARSHWIAEAVKEFGYRYSPRLHVLIWGDKRGV